MELESIAFKCKVITPMFLGNAIKGQAELRPSAIKAAIRFWWRAMNGDMAIEDKEDEDGKPIKGLRTREAEIFGGAAKEGKKVGRSKVCISVSTLDPWVIKVSAFTADSSRKEKEERNNQRQVSDKHP